MALLVDYAPWLLAMLLLLCGSAFFSASEAALFYLSRRDRRAFANGSTAQQIAAALLEQPDRLLTTVLFWNLMVNISYFTLSSVVALRLQRDDRLVEATWLTIGSLFTLILFGEMLPKSLAVIQSRFLAPLVAVPLAVAVRVLSPVIPMLRLVTLLSRRLVLPRFQPEPYLALSDLERAVTMSTTDASLLRHEEAVLQNILSLSDLRVDELMTPRTQIRTFRPPVSLSALEGHVPVGGYLLISEPDSDEVAAAVPLTRLYYLPDDHLERYAEEVVYVPWSATVAAAMEEMLRRDRRVTVVVNEHGETIGILTYDDILDTIFAENASRSLRLLNRSPIEEVEPGVYHVLGITSLRRLYKYFNLPRPESSAITVAGLVQEQTQRLPAVGDECHWNGFHLKVIEILQRGQIVVEFRRREQQPQEESA